MHKTLRALPSLDFLRGFEAAGRRLSFTLAAEELFVTQSALSRQIKALEDALGIALFERGTRARAHAFRRGVSSRGRQHPCRNRRGGRRREGRRLAAGVTLSTTVSFASLWIIPRLSRFRAAHPEVEVYVSADDRVVDVTRGDVDVVVRYLPDASAPAGALRLFGERMMPVASPSSSGAAARRSRGRPISRAMCCCISTTPKAACRGSTGRSWLVANGRRV